MVPVAGTLIVFCTVAPGVLAANPSGMAKVVLLV